MLGMQCESPFTPVVQGLSSPGVGITRFQAQPLRDIKLQRVACQLSASNSLEVYSMSQETERMEKEVEELKLQLATKQDELCRQENSDFADAGVIKEEDLR
jgi:hypothetical protein